MNSTRRRAKIVVTIGPASQDETVIAGLLQAGADVARLNFSHGTYESHARVYRCLRETSERLNRPLTIFQDLQGPKIRTGELPGGQLELLAGEIVLLSAESTKPGIASSPAVHVGDGSSSDHSPPLIQVDFPDFINYLQPGSRVLLDDGNLELLVTTIRGQIAEARVVLPGLLKSRKGVNLPGASLNVPSMTPKDEADLEFGLKLGVDAVAISFVRTASDIQRVRMAIKRLAPERMDIPIIAKLERPEALDNLDEILATVDGVMVARGDMGVEMSPEAVPIAQKRIIDAANTCGRFVITATQMLDSMVHAPRPTRAEASDVANAIFDGTDAVMLSGETATGQYPIQAVEVMHAIICQAEAHLAKWGRRCSIPEPMNAGDDAFYLSRAAGELAHDRNVAAIAVFTKSGRTALLLSKIRPEVPILAFTPKMQTYRWMNILWNVTPFLVPHAETVEDMLSSVEHTMLTNQAVSPGQQVVLVCGYPVSQLRPANLALLHTISATSGQPPFH